MALDPNLYWAFASIGVTFLFYGFDKFLEFGNPKSPFIRGLKAIFGAGIFAMGAFILYLLLLLK